MDAHDGSVLSSKPKQVGTMLLSGNMLSEECSQKFRNHELEDEIKDLIDDQVYNDFVVAIAKEKPVDKEYPNEDGDLEFSPKKNVPDVEAETNVGEVGDAMSFNDEISTSSESETSVLGENEEHEATKPYDQLSEVSPDELEMIKNHVPVAVPKNSLKATQNRFPPFWRVKHAIRNVGENDGYNSEEDVDYLPKNEENELSPIGEQEIPTNMKDQNDSSGMSYQSSDDEKSESEELAKEVKDLQEMPDIQQELKGLAEMVVEMSVVGNHSSDQQTLENASDVCNDDMEEGNLSFSPVNFVESIIQFNDDDYKEEVDQDYDPIPDEANIAGSNYEESNPNNIHSEENGRNSDESSSSDSERSNSANSEGSNSGDSDKEA